MAEKDGTSDSASRHYECVLCLESKAPGFPLDTDDPSRVDSIGDVRRHLGRYHLNFSQSRCLGGCNKIFNWQRAFAIHDCDGSTGIGGKFNTKYSVLAYNQVVFACGFRGCGQVFDGSTRRSMREVKQGYLNHIRLHYKEPGFAEEHWSFTTRFRNLLRHRFPERTVQGLPQDLVWELESSHHLLARLETRRLPVDLEAFLSEIIDAGRQHPGEITVQACRTPPPSPADELTAIDQASTTSPTNSLPIRPAKRCRGRPKKSDSNELHTPLKRPASEVIDDGSSLPEPKRVKSRRLHRGGALPSLFQELAQSLADADGTEHPQVTMRARKTKLQILENATEAIRSLTLENQELREQVEKERRELHWFTILQRE